MVDLPRPLGDDELGVIRGRKNHVGGHASAGKVQCRRQEHQQHQVIECLDLIDAAVDK